MRISDWSSDVCSSDLSDEGIVGTRRQGLDVGLQRGGHGLQISGRLAQVLHGQRRIGDQLFYVAAVVCDGTGDLGQVADELLDVLEIAVAEQRLRAQQTQDRKSGV